MQTIEESIVADVPVRTAYDQWTQFEDFPQFMEGVKEVRQLDDKRLSWRVSILGKEVTWTADITEQVPDQRISWRSTSGATQLGTVTFAPAGPDQTRISLRIAFETEGAVEAAAAALGAVKLRVKGDLERFKEFIEKSGTPTGEWRGEIHGGQVTDQPVR